MPPHSVPCWTSWGIPCHWHCVFLLRALGGRHLSIFSSTGSGSALSHWTIPLRSLARSYCSGKISRCSAWTGGRHLLQRSTLRFLVKHLRRGRSCGKTARTPPGSHSRRFPPYCRRKLPRSPVRPRSWSWRLPKRTSEMLQYVRRR